MNGHKSKAIRREMARLNPEGYAKPYEIKGMIINPQRQEKKRIAAGMERPRQ
jgi:hypothetical protein